MKNPVNISTVLDRDSISGCEVFLADLSSVLASAKTVKTQAATSRRRRSPNERANIDRFWYQSGENIVSAKIMVTNQLLVRLDGEDGRKRSALFNAVLPKTMKMNNLLSPEILAEGVKDLLESLDNATIVTSTEIHEIAMTLGCNLPLEKGQRILLTSKAPFHDCYLAITAASGKRIAAPAQLTRMIAKKLGAAIKIQDANSSSSRTAADALHAPLSWHIRRDAAYVDLNDITPVERMAYIAKGEEFDLAPFRQNIAEKT